MELKRMFALYEERTTEFAPLTEMFGSGGGSLTTLCAVSVFSIEDAKRHPKMPDAIASGKAREVVVATLDDGRALILGPVGGEMTVPVVDLQPSPRFR